MRKPGRRTKNAAIFATVVATALVLPPLLLSLVPLLLGLTCYLVVWIVMWTVGFIWFGMTVDYRNRSRGKAKKKFETVVRYDRPPELVQQIVSSATRDLLRVSPEYNVVEESPGFTAISTPMSLWGWGEEVTIFVEGTSIRVKSECILPLQVIDWGRNRSNVDRACHSLLQASSAAL